MMKMYGFMQFLRSDILSERNFAHILSDIAVNAKQGMENTLVKQ